VESRPRHQKQTSFTYAIDDGATRLLLGTVPDNAVMRRLAESCGLRAVGLTMAQDF
jgi:hypothetical protein